MRRKQQCFQEGRVVWMYCKQEWYFVGYIDFLKVEINWGGVFRFKEDDYFISFRGLVFQFWVLLGEFFQVEEESVVRFSERVRRFVFSLLLMLVVEDFGSFLCNFNIYCFIVNILDVVNVVCKCIVFFNDINIVNMGSFILY